MREWLSWWSTTLPRSGSRVRVPSRALLEVFFKTSFLLYVKQHTFLNSKVTNPAHTGKDILYAHVSSNDKSL